VDEVAAIAHDMAQKGRHTVTHNRGTEVIEAGAIRFGLEVRQVGQDGGMAIHVLSDAAGQEIELLASALREVEAKVPPMMAAARG
jgi:hypothetical protein